MSTPLTTEQLATFARDGFVVLSNFYERAEVEAVQRG
ncbi:MAG: phytanoyl-CoA dioxygenase family protein, partial [Verrucomicrobiales bacterium]|nr:phytanoyl-CoA dioxygenase family protein [Verrucomicrobiales bacterium]